MVVIESILIRPTRQVSGGCEISVTPMLGLWSNLENLCMYADRGCPRPAPCLPRKSAAPTPSAPG